MSKLQAIEERLIQLNEYKFQELCDSYLAIRNKNFAAFSRIGSVTGKEKTRKGTPDTLILLPSGRYLFLEYTTNKSEGINKLKDDVLKCLDFEKTGIPAQEIAEIILAINFNLKPSEIYELTNLLRKTSISLTLITLDSLAIDLHLNHRDLAHLYLDLPLDTGQIISLEEFKKQYNAKANNIASPLDNEFLHREQETAHLRDTIAVSNFVIITGPPGVGKTRLALETINRFLLDNHSFEAFCISYKHHDLLDDLYLYFKDDKDYIIFVDDANRIDAFSQITGFYNSPRTGILKIVITVRDYAYAEIDRICQEFNPKRIDLAKFTDAQIIDLITSEPIKITNQTYHKPILNIADGNLRLAIMAARLARKTQRITSLSDVSELFDGYFSTFAKDKNEFANELSIKCLGLVAFFYTMPYKEREITEQIANDFGISYHSFVEVIDRLDKLELVDVQFEYVKISEQNLSTYFFYKAFIKESLLSFDVLLSKYFEKNQRQFDDCVIPANNLFGPSKVMDKLRPSLVNYFSKINDINKAFEFLSTFWYYLQTEALEFVYLQIKNIPVKEITRLEIRDDNKQPHVDRDKIIALLNNFLDIPYEFPQYPTELLFDYVARVPEAFTEVVHKIKNRLAFDVDDMDYGYQRQAGLFSLLKNGIEQDEIVHISIFHALCPTFLQHNFHHSKGGRNHTIQMYFFRLKLSEAVRKLRESIWMILESTFDKKPGDAFNVLQKCVQPAPDVDKELMQFDLPFVIGVIKRKLSTNLFPHCRYVHEQIRWFKKNEISHPNFELLKSQFSNRIYLTYLKVDWNTFRDKEVFDFKKYDEYERLKDREIRSSFILNSLDEVQSFLDDFVYLKHESKNDWNYNRTLDIVVDENFKISFEIGIALLKTIATRNSDIGYVPLLCLQTQLVNRENAAKIWEIINNSQFIARNQWKFSYFECLSTTLSNDRHHVEIIKAFEEIHQPTTILVDRLAKFLPSCPSLFEEILRIVVRKNADIETRIFLWTDFFNRNFENLGHDMTLIKKAYLQQINFQHHFDYEGEGFLKILREDGSFLVDYLNSISVENRLSSTERDLGFIWEIEGIELRIKEAFNFVIANDDYYGIGDHYCNSFYKRVTAGYMQKADDFLFSYLKENFQNSDKVNVVIDIIRNSRKELFDDALLLYISLTQDVNSFAKIWWRGNGGNVSVGDVIFGDIEAAEWKAIQHTVEKSSLGIDLIPIKKYLNDQIEYALRSADWERKRRFLTRY